MEAVRARAQALSFIRTLAILGTIMDILAMNSLKAYAAIKPNCKPLSPYTLNRFKEAYTGYTIAKLLNSRTIG